MNHNDHPEIEFQQLTPKGQAVCGDIFLSRRVKEEGRTVLVLSDGVGHGIKASVLATLTATMALNYLFHTKPEIAAKLSWTLCHLQAKHPITLRSLDRNWKAMDLLER